MKKKIIHKAIYHEHQLITPKYSAVLRKDVIYLCNQAVKANRDKCRFQWKYVTCINCLKQKPTSLNKDLEGSKASPNSPTENFSKS